MTASQRLGPPGPSDGRMASPAAAEAEGSGRRSRLTVCIARALGTVVVTFRGSLDRDDGPRLRAALKDLIEHQGNRNVVVDLHELRTLDLMGLRVLGVAAGWAGRRGGSFRLADPSSAVGRTLRNSGLADLVLVSRTGPRARSRPPA
jgi:anti-anti-sigma factor